MLRGIDVSHWKNDLNVNAVAADFVIAKATGGTGYVDDFCDTAIQAAIAGGKKFGFYHYRGDGFGYAAPEVEADFFVDNCLNYFGHGIPILDWERGGNPNVGDVAWAKAWLDHVFARTGVRPIIYMSLSITQSYDWTPVVQGNYGLWTAAYVDNNTPIPNYQMDANRDPNPHWDGNVNDVLWQFTSTGRLDGYGGNLDCNFFYGTRATWDAYAGANPAPTPPAPEPTTTTTTEAPAPEPTTTTTTEALPTPPDPDPTTTTTSTETTTSTTDTQPEPPDSTTTTSTETPGPVEPPARQSFWVAIWSVFLAIINWFKGEKK